jgi:hypothetical protein
MNNHFICITSEGGYLGRFFWGNTGSIGSCGIDLKWGQVFFLSNFFADHFGSAWAGSNGMIRYLTKPFK